MSEICFLGDGEPSPPPDSTYRQTDILHLNAAADLTASSSSAAPPHHGRKHRRLHHLPRRCRNSGGSSQQSNPDVETVKYGVTSVCGRRREMEDTVSIHPSFSAQKNQPQFPFHFFGVFDGHGCSLVSMSCENRMHEIVKEEIEKELGETEDWKKCMQQSFARMDDEVKGISNFTCRCELQTPHQYDTVGSTALVAVVTPDKFIISNCGDSRAVLCRRTAVVPLSSDHKFNKDDFDYENRYLVLIYSGGFGPDRPDELCRIESTGGRVIYWEGARVLGVLATSRAIGDGYLKPYVISEPEVAIIDRTTEDEFMVLASDGLWDVVSNETACEAVRTCMQAQQSTSALTSTPSERSTGFGSDQVCSEASIVLTKLAMAKQSSDNISVVVIDLKMDH